MKAMVRPSRASYSGEGGRQLRVAREGKCYERGLHGWL